MSFLEDSSENHNNNHHDHDFSDNSEIDELLGNKQKTGIVDDVTVEDEEIISDHQTDDEDVIEEEVSEEEIEDENYDEEEVIDDEMEEEEVIEESEEGGDMNGEEASTNPIQESMIPSHDPGDKLIAKVASPGPIDEPVLISQNENLSPAISMGTKQSEFSAKPVVIEEDPDPKITKSVNTQTPPKFIVNTMSSATGIDLVGSISTKPDKPIVFNTEENEIDEPTIINSKANVASKVRTDDELMGQMSEKSKYYRIDPVTGAINKFEPSPIYSTPSPTRAPAPKSPRKAESVHKYLPGRVVAPRPFDEQQIGEEPTDEGHRRENEHLNLQKTTAAVSTEGKPRKHLFIPTPILQKVNENEKAVSPALIDNSEKTIKTAPAGSGPVSDIGKIPSQPAENIPEKDFGGNSKQIETISESIPEKTSTTTPELSLEHPIQNSTFPKEQYMAVPPKPEPNTDEQDIMVKAMEQGEISNDGKDGITKKQASGLSWNRLPMKAKMLVIFTFVLLIVLLVSLIVALKSKDNDDPVDVASKEIPPANITKTLPPIKEETPSPIPVPAPERSWIQTGASFSERDEAAGFGTSVSISSSRMVTGAPQTLQNGAVLIYDNLDGAWATDPSSEIFGRNAGDEFGASIDMTDDVLVVGAPSVPADGTTTPVGAAYYYAKEANGWFQVGNTIRGDPGVYGTNEKFGSAVAVSSTFHVVVGAPGSSIDLKYDIGRVYAFQYDQSLKNWTLLHNEVGYVDGARLGTSVDISRDGSHFIAGAPAAANGYATVYEWKNSNWTSLTKIQGLEKGEGFGSSVKIISEDGSLIAVGAPNYQTDKGRVMIYEKIGGSYRQLGSPIEGKAGDFFGKTNTVSGGYSPRPSVIIGSAFGYVQRYDFDEATSAWVEYGQSVSTGFDLTAIDSSTTAELFVVGGKQNAVIYELE